MADERTYTQAEVDALVAERNKGLEGKRDELLTELRDAKAKLKGFDGVDVSEHRALQTKVAELEQQSKANKAGMTSDELVKLRQDVTADLLKQFAGDPSAGLRAFPWAATLASENRALKLDSVVKAEMAKGGARAERIDALFRLTSDRFDLTDDGKPMLTSSPGLEVGKYVTDDLKKEYPEFYNGSGSSGGGASKSNAGGGGFRTVVGTKGPDFLKNVAEIAKGNVAVAE